MVVKVVEDVVVAVVEMAAVAVDNGSTILANLSPKSTSRTSSWNNITTH